MKNEKYWFENGLSFSCERCGHCCSGQPGYVWVLPEELDAISKYFTQEISTYVRRVGTRFSLIEKTNGDCVFLERDNSGLALCCIHEVKPKQCKTWPFWHELLKSKETWDEEAKKCPGMNKGQKHSFDKIMEIKIKNT